jgi:hypothetical protein
MYKKKRKSWGDYLVKQITEVNKVLDALRSLTVAARKLAASLMALIVVLIGIYALFGGPTTAQAGSHDNEGSRLELIVGDSTTYLWPIKPNAYGAGVHADATGHAFQWLPQGQPNFGPGPTLQVTSNHYGLGSPCGSIWASPEAGVSVWAVYLLSDPGTSLG